MSAYHIDINCDLGEGAGNDAQLMPFLSSCNIACGAHAGSEAIIEETIALALKHKTKIGAHPSFPDRENFGRNEMNLSSSQLRTIIIDQITLVGKLAEIAGVKLNHVKPHGALYNMAVGNEEIADAIINSLVALNSPLILYVPFGSIIARRAIEKNIKIKYEAFADRNYNDDLTLVSRKRSDAVLHDPEQIIEHVVRMIKEQNVKTITGALVNIKADTLCVHGDNPNAVAIVTSLRTELEATNIIIE
jgi:UPF0271 protein